jgi:hypothetical protein
MRGDRAGDIVCQSAASMSSAVLAAASIPGGSTSSTK